MRNQETECQYQRVIVVDDDLGRSGTGSVDRPGFSRLLTAVCSGDVGAVRALEASRLARNNPDWHHLIDLFAMAATLVIDHDDPRLLNDRLLLGLKGTMSEFEISLRRVLEHYELQLTVICRLSNQSPVIAALPTKCPYPAHRRNGT